jgi:3-hydroxyacyl-[acyl-carrier-protein] dehydratase
MRWIWIDRFLEFESGRRAVAVKNVSLAEEHLHDCYPGLPIMPPSLLIEGMAQTAGILVGEARSFAEKVILAKIRKARFEDRVVAGDCIRYEADIETINDQGAATAGQVFRNGRLVGRVDLFFSHVDQNMSGLEFPAENFVFTDQFKELLASFRNDVSKPAGSARKQEDILT